MEDEADIADAIRLGLEDAARSRAGGGGTGLGLAICQSLLHAQGGHLEIDSVLGEGTTVRVSLCLAEPPK